MTTLEILSRLVAFPTVSADSNLDCVAYIREYLSGHGIEASILPSPDGRKANLFATVGPAVPGGVVLSGHTDVVPVEGQDWSSDPWTLSVRRGRAYGRGTCDMKGFGAAMLAAVPRMQAAGLKRPVHLAFSYDEEVGCKGAPDLVGAMAAALPPPAAVIVGEPTKMEIVNAHKGSLSFFTDVTGHSVHSSRIDQGVSAVMVAARLVTWLADRMAANRAAADSVNPFEPPYTTLHCGMIQGGTAANIVAASCRFVTDIRAIPQDDPAAHKAAYLAYIKNTIEPEMKGIAPDANIEVSPRAFVPGLKPEANGAAEALVRKLTGARSGVVSYTTEAGIFQQAGWSCVVCGPGSIAQAHQADEFIELSELEAADAFMGNLVRDLAS